MSNLIRTEITTEDYLHRPMWVANLSNGLTAYQSDDNPSMPHHNSWTCLKQYAEENDLYIRNMVLRFRDHTEVIGDGHDAYYFVHMLLGNFIGYNQIFYNAGVLVDGVININQWVIPEIITMDSYTKNVNDQYVEDSLIRGKPFG